MYFWVIHIPKKDIYVQIKLLRRSTQVDIYVVFTEGAFPFCENVASPVASSKDSSYVSSHFGPQCVVSFSALLGTFLIASPIVPQSTSSDFSLSIDMALPVDNEITSSILALALSLVGALDVSDSSLVTILAVHVVNRCPMQIRSKSGITRPRALLIILDIPWEPKNCKEASLYPE